jgi:chemotaxis protein MotB
LARAIEVAFQAMGVFPASGTSVPLQADGDVPPGDIQMLQNVQPSASIGRLVSPVEGDLGTATESGGVVADLQQELQKALAPEIFKKDVSLRTQPDGLVISLREVGFFDSGSAELRATAMPAFQRIAQVLLERPYQIRIEGHTDNVAIHTAKFASNWELSTARAIEVIRLLISDMRFPPERLSAGGYGEFHPVASNATEQGRSQNRRVDIVILRPIAAESEKAAVRASNEKAGAVPSPSKILPDLPLVVETDAKPSPPNPSLPNPVPSKSSPSKPSPSKPEQR